MVTWCQTVCVLLASFSLRSYILSEFKFINDLLPEGYRYEEKHEGYSRSIPKSLKLYYFDAPGRAEPIRVILAYGGIQYKDIRLSYDDWKTLKPEMPWGQVPVLEIDGRKVPQSIAITRYVAKLANLTGTNDVEDLEIDSVADTFLDIDKRMADIHFEKDESKRNNLASMFWEVLPLYLERLELRAKFNGGYIALKRLTWADIMFLITYERLVISTSRDLLNDYPNLLKLKENVLNVPNIRQYIKNRPKSPPTQLYDLQEDV